MAMFQFNCNRITTHSIDRLFRKIPKSQTVKKRRETDQNLEQT